MESVRFISSISFQTLKKIVKRTYGVWKRRFPCLSKGLTTKLLCSTTIIVACDLLYNMALLFNDVLLEDKENI